MSKEGTYTGYLGDEAMIDAQLQVFEGDLDADCAAEFEIAAKEVGLAVDVETTGLSLKNEHVEVVSLAVPGSVAVVTIDQGQRPIYLGGLLENDSILKVFDHALFDLSFLRNAWDYRVNPVFCTKVAARIVGISRNPTLAELVSTLLEVRLNKAERLSDWTSRPLSDSQIDYAASDVLHLHDLHRVLTWRLADEGRTELFESCMGYLATRVELALLGFDDVFACCLTPT
jgi:ribonuclease D